jgi:hypothetical protein
MNLPVFASPLCTRSNSGSFAAKFGQGETAKVFVVAIPQVHEHAEGGGLTQSQLLDAV